MCINFQISWKFACCEVRIFLPNLSLIQVGQIIANHSLQGFLELFFYTHLVQVSECYFNEWVSNGILFLSLKIPLSNGFNELCKSVVVWLSIWGSMILSGSWYGFVWFFSEEAHKWKFLQSLQCGVQPTEAELIAWLRRHAIVGQRTNAGLGLDWTCVAGRGIGGHGVSIGASCFLEICQHLFFRNWEFSWEVLVVYKGTRVSSYS